MNKNQGLKPKKAHFETIISQSENNKIFSLDVADLPSGTNIDLPIHFFSSSKPGPTLLLTGGLHGDEVNGVEIVRRLIVDGILNNLEIGKVIAIPLLNIYGFINFSRAVPDGKDVNRSFPGSANGSLASQVAHKLSKQILPFIDFGIDFHTGGASRYNYPQIRFTAKDSKAKELAQVFAAPYLLPGNPILKSFRQEAFKQGKSILVFEGGEALRYDQFSIDIALAGTKRILNYLKMKNFEMPTSSPKTQLFEQKKWIRAAVSGLFIWEKSSGEKIQKGERLGKIHDPHGVFEKIVFAPCNAEIIGHNNAPVVNQGDALFHLGVF